MFLKHSTNSILCQALPKLIAAKSKPNYNLIPQKNLRESGRLGVCLPILYPSSLRFDRNTQNNQSRLTIALHDLHWPVGDQLFSEGDAVTSRSTVYSVVELTPRRETRDRLRQCFRHRCQGGVPASFLSQNSFLCAGQAFSSAISLSTVSSTLPPASARKTRTAVCHL